MLLTLRARRLPFICLLVLASVGAALANSSTL
jgi:hypothetical protein